MSSTEQQHAIDLFRKEAMKNHNIKCIETGNEDFLRERSKEDCNERPVMCSGCNGFFQKAYKARHQLLCPANTNSLMLPMVSLQSIDKYDSISDGFKSLLNTLRLDDIADIVKTDDVILMIGNRFYNSLKRKQDKRTEYTKYVRSRIRLTARIYKAFKTRYDRQTGVILDCKENNSADIFRRETITILAEAINEICDKENSDSDVSVTEQKSGLKISILNLLKANAQYLMGYFLMKNQDQKKEKVADFLQILKLLENEIFGDAFYDINYRQNVNRKKAKSLPNNDDVKMLLEECVKVMESADVFDVLSSQYINVRSATATYLIMFNARRGGEPVRLLIRQWEEALNGDWTDQVPVDGNDILVTFQTGKGIDHLVPVMFPIETHKAMRYLVNTDARENVNIHSTNKYIFASVNQSCNHASGWHCVNEMLVKISRKGSLNATKNRHRVASLLSKMLLSEKEKELIFKHFGHSKNVNEDIYQAAAGTLQLQSTGQKLLQVNTDPVKRHYYLKQDCHMCICRNFPIYLMLFFQ